MSATTPEIELLAQQFEITVQPFLEIYCLGCHGESKQEANLNLSPFTSLSAVQASPGHWELILERISTGEMPPKDAGEHPSQEDRSAIIGWIKDLRTLEANRSAGDPGSVPARRLNLTEYNCTIRDLTGVDIRPTREFPVDPANVAGFANSGESLFMSPALFNKYLAAGRHVADHLILTPSGFVFAPHPAVTWSDRDQFAVRRIVDFYAEQTTDYAELLVAAWQFRHRQVLDLPYETLADVADAHGVSRKYLVTLMDVLSDGNNHAGPIVQLPERWEQLPVPGDSLAELPVSEFWGIRNWIIEQRNQRRFVFSDVMIPQLNPSTQPGVLWKNRLIAEHRRKGTLTEEEVQDSGLQQAIERFCNVFPDKFVLTERGRMNLPFEKQNKGRLLGAGFHLQIGFYRDDGPLYDMLLNDEEKSELDRLWHELEYITDVPVRQFQEYIYFERAEGREIIMEAEFDFT